MRILTQRVFTWPLNCLWFELRVWILWFLHFRLWFNLDLKCPLSLLQSNLPALCLLLSTNTPPKQRNPYFIPHQLLTNSLHECHESKEGIQPTTSEVAGACSDDFATWLLMCKIKQFYSKSLNSLALACVSLYFFIQQLPNSFLGRTATYKGSCSQNTWDASRGSVFPQISISWSENHLVFYYSLILSNVIQLIKKSNTEKIVVILGRLY